MIRSCPFETCDGTGVIPNDDAQPKTFEWCPCRPQIVAAARTRSLSSTIPRKFRGLSFDRPPITLVREPVREHVRLYVSTIEERLTTGDGLWLHGPVGTGKTSLAMLVAQAGIAAGRTVAVYSLPRLLAEIRATFDDTNADTSTALIERLASVDLLNIDDIGAEKTSTWVLEQLYTIINCRYEDERSVVITTNMERDDLAEQIGDRTVSRLDEMCELLPVGGADLRREARS
jgi:DNA replication protein DnaC